MPHWAFETFAASVPCSINEVGFLKLTRKGTKEMRELLFFDNMITPKLITIVYWILMVLVVIGAIISLSGGFTFMHFLGTLVALPLGLLAVRMYCELLIVMFKMNEALQEIRKK
jgi:hypothetical protein